MKRLSAILLVCCLISGGTAKSGTAFLGYQDSLGQYSFGYSAPGSARSEVRTLNGATRGSYSYVDASGNIQSAEYVADGEHGFRVVATNLPQAPLPVQETPEVAAARLAHLQAFKSQSGQLEPVSTRISGEQQKKSDQPEKEEQDKAGGSSEQAKIRVAAKTEGQEAEQSAGSIKTVMRKQEIASQNSQSVQSPETSGLRRIEQRIGEQQDKIDKINTKVFLAKAAGDIGSSGEIPIIPILNYPNALSYSYVNQPYFTHVSQPAALPLLRILPAKQQIQPLVLPQITIVPGASGTVPETRALKDNEGNEELQGKPSNLNQKLGEENMKMKKKEAHC